MRLFVKENQLLFVVQLLQFSLFFGLLWLSGFRDLGVLLYAGLLGSFVFISYLTYYYLSRRSFFKRLKEPVKTLDESLQRTDDVPISEALNTLLTSQYYLYKDQVTRLEARQDEHLLFMDRWIHQMKTPLSVIELMATDLDEPLSSDMREETDRMKNGLNMVLYTARLRTIEKDFNVLQVDLLQIVQEVNREHKRFFIRNQVYPVVKGEKDIVVETDEKWLYFILTQLIQNAVKYSAGKAKEIKIVLSKVEQQLVLEVVDQGVGIPKEDLSRIFDSFYTGENGRVFRESTGMGLYLVKEVVQYLGHQIEVSSEVGKGATFRIEF